MAQQMQQGLFKRDPKFSAEEFSETWYRDHGSLLIPFFLHCGITYYAQVHGPIEVVANEKVEGIDINEYTNTIEMPASDVLKLWAPSEPFPPWIQDYYAQIIEPDEIRFMGALGKEVIVPLPAGEEVVRGARKVVIRDRVVVEGFPQEALDKAWEVWREFEARGKGVVNEEEEEGRKK